MGLPNGEGYTSFSKVSHVGDTLFTSELENNLKWYMDWGLLQIGAWSDVSRPSSGAFGAPTVIIMTTLTGGWFLTAQLVLRLRWSLNTATAISKSMLQIKPLGGMSFNTTLCV